MREYKKGEFVYCRVRDEAEEMWTMRRYDAKSRVYGKERHVVEKPDGSGALDYYPDKFVRPMIDDSGGQD